MRLMVVILVMGQLLAAPVLAADAAERDVLLQQAIQLSLDAEFEPSLALFDKLLQDQELDARRLTLLLSERSLVLYALGKQEALEDNLRRLARIDPHRVLSERAPPELQMRWQTIAASAQQERRPEDVEPGPAHAYTQASQPIGLAPLSLSARAPEAALRPDNRKKRALLIGGAVLTAAATLAVALVLTIPGSAPADRTSINPSVEF